MLRRLFPMLFLGSAAFAQLSQDQKVTDFMQLVGLYVKNYEPYSWKRDVIGFDLYNVKPWLDRVKQTADDISFYDVCVQYVAALQDSHDEFILPSDFQAYLNFRVDIYDGIVLIDSIDRSALPSAAYPFQRGDELVSVDGKPVADLINAYIPYAANGSGNTSSRRRLAADAITLRTQAFFPRAHEVGNTSVIVVRRQNGNLETYTVPWRKLGTPLVTAGRVPSPVSAAHLDVPQTLRRRPVLGRGPLEPAGDDDSAVNAWGAWSGPPMDRELEAVPDYLKPLRELQTMQAVEVPLGFSGFGAPTPVFNPPAGFRLRLGASQSDQFLSGTFPVGTSSVGFIRIPTMAPASTSLAVQQFRSEIAYFNQNTDAVVIDVMRNGGGSLCYVENLAQYLIPHPFRSIAYEIRATNFWVEVYSGSLYNAILSKADQWVIDVYSLYLQVVQQALHDNRASTGNLPICGPNFEGIQPATDANGNNLAYTKPILVLTDEFTLSAAEAFTMILQDENRAVIFGTRTDGGGGNPGAYNATAYSEGQARVTRTLVTRARQVATPGFPPSHYLENTGVYPDILNDYATKDNLLNGGRSFISAFSDAVANLVSQGH